MRAMLRSLKTLAKSLLPESVLLPIVAIRERRLSHRLNAQWQVTPLSRRLFERFGTTVMAGPFAGLVLPAEVASEHVGPYLFGAYEHELHTTIKTLPSEQVTRVVNVGAKFGYYAVGLAKLLNVPVTAFDVDPWARKMTRTTAELNGASALVTIEAACTRPHLADLPAGTLVVIDCDGCEMKLLSPPLSAGLRRAMIIVEVHEMFESGAGHTLKTWLEETHAVREIPSDDIAQPAPVDLSEFSEEERTLATRELRPHQSWLVCVPKVR
jgi:hypothetical protein